MFIAFKNEGFNGIELNTQDLLHTTFSVPKKCSFIFRKLLADVCVHPSISWLNGWCLYYGY